MRDNGVHRMPMTKRARTVLTTTGWVALVALTGVVLVPAPEAVAAGVTTSNYVVAERAPAAWTTSSAPPRSEAA